MLYFDKKGKPIISNKWRELFNDKKYQIVKKTNLKNGLIVSTVWLGLDHRINTDTGKPVIFETLVMGKKNTDYDGCRACTEEEALKDHEHFIKKGNKIPMGKIVAEEI